MNYQLKSSKGGMNGEKTYEFGAQEPPRRNARSSQAGASRPVSAQQPRRSYREDEAFTRTTTLPTQRKKPSRRLQARRASSAQRYSGEGARKAYQTAMERARQRQLEAHERAEAAHEERNVRTLKSHRIQRISRWAVLVPMLCSAMFMLIILNMVRMHEFDIRLRTLDKEVSTLSEEKKKLANQLEDKNDLSYIEDYAVNRLGMVKSDQLTRQYVSLEGRDKIELVEEKAQSRFAKYFTDLRALWTAIGEKLAAFREYIE